MDVGLGLDDLPGRNAQLGLELEVGTGVELGCSVGLGQGQCHKLIHCEPVDATCDRRRRKDRETDRVGGDLEDLRDRQIQRPGDVTEGEADPPMVTLASFVAVAVAAVSDLD